MTSDDDEFGEVDENDLLQATQQAELRSKTIPRELESNRPVKRRRLDNTEDGNATPPRHVGKLNSRQRIFVPQHSDIPEDTFFSQEPPSSQSPYRIRGCQWRKKPPPSAEPDGKSSRLLSSANGRLSTACPAEVTTSQDIQNNLQNEEGCTLKNLQIRNNSSGNRNVDNEECLFVLSQHEDDQEQSLSLRTTYAGASQPNFRQTTLFGNPVSGQESQQQAQSNVKRNWPLAGRNEAPTHHKLDQEAMRSWQYPMNLGIIRDYQYSIVSHGLFHNLLVALPTGLGKTFIAATIMLNWFRWTKEAQIVFVAPTKPLVSQQVDACFKIVGIPRSATTMLTGGTATGIRAEEWRSKRVFFMTPQTIMNDLKTGICDPKNIVLVVVDEAHRATGSYAYVEVIKFIRRFNTSFRVLALTATPGSSVESVQEVIDGLGISRVEIRTEESLDIRRYVHHRNIDTMLFENSDEMVMVMDLFSKALQPLVNKLCSLNAYYNRDPMTLTPYGCTQARVRWMNSDAGRKSSFPMKAMVNSIFTILASLAHAIELLKFHGITPFFQKLADFESDLEQKGEKGSKYKKQITEGEDFRKLMSLIRGWTRSPDFICHPKLEYLLDVVMNHFLDASEGRGTGVEISAARTRVMIFAHYRDSAEEVVRVLKRKEDMIRPHIFIGQTTTKGSEGMGQKRQLEIIDKFRSGIYNTLVATSIGEEGLDIGEVDLIVCYDASASPIRMLQRMGRTGRKRAGKIVVTLMKGKEEDNFMKAKDNYEKMQKLIASGTRFAFHENLSPRIIPREIQPTVDKKVIEIPVENTQPDLPEPRRRGRAPKKPPKKFHMPDNVRTGFTKASRLDDNAEDLDTSGLTSERDLESPPRSPSPVPLPPLSSVVLTTAEEQTLNRTYLRIGGDEPQTVVAPRLDAFPLLQRRLRPINSIKHGSLTTKFVKTLNGLESVSNDTIEGFEESLESADKIEVDAQSAKRVAFTQRRRCAGKSFQAESSDLMPISIHLDDQQSSGVMQNSSHRSRSSITARADDKDATAPYSYDNQSQGSQASMVSSTSAIPTIVAKPKRFYVSPKFSPGDMASQESFPDVMSLIRQKEHYEDSEEPIEEMLPHAPRGARKLIEGDSDDE